MKAWIKGISVLAPGIDDWAMLKTILAGSELPGDGELQPQPPEVLSPRERRRTSRAQRLALNAAVAACRAADIPFDASPCVFASALGDGEVNDAIMHALTLPDRPISPTHFHNSVHNAAAGYWSIGGGNMRSSVSIAAGDATFGAGLMAAMALLANGETTVMLVASDMPMPPPLGQTRPVSAGMAVGIVLADNTTQTGPVLEIAGGTSLPETAMTLPSLAPLAKGTPPGRALPLLAAIADAGPAGREVVLAAGSNGFRIKVRVSA